MQASGSFELARNGRKRPTNLLKTRDSAPDVHCYSPSFNPTHSSSHHAAADGLPPTPITAGMPKDVETPSESPQVSRSTVTLPSINDMLRSAPTSSAPSSSSSVMTPPASGRMGALAPLVGSYTDEHDEGRFPGPRPAWVQDSESSTFVGVRPPVSRHSSLESRYSKVSPRSFGDLVREQDNSGVVGLGFGMSDATPRIGCFGSNALGLHTPTQSTIEQPAPSAPCLAQEGRFESTVPSSPIFPPLQGWNTDLRSSSSASKSSHVGYARPRPTSVAMQREQAVTIEDTMPQQTGVFGLGVSMSGNVDADVHRVVEEQQRLSSSSSHRLDASATPSVNRITTGAASTGLTPALDMARLRDVESAGPVSPSSPSLRAKSKKRSDHVRRQAEAAVMAGLATRDPVTPTAEEEASPSATSDGGDSAFAQPSSMASPRKRTLGARDTNTAAPVKSSRSGGRTSPSRQDNPASPWGVFRLKEEGWKPLGPPGGGKGVGINAVMKGSSSSQGKKQKRLTVSGSSRPSSRDSNKENDVPASMQHGKKTSSDGVAGGKRPSTAGAKLGDVFGNEQQMTAAKAGRFAHIHAASRPTSRPSSANGVAGKKRSPCLGVR